MSTYVSPILGSISIAGAGRVRAPDQPEGILPCLTTSSPWAAPVRSAGARSSLGRPASPRSASRPRPQGPSVGARRSSLDTFSVNVLTRSSLIYAILAVTVDLLWGYTGILTFGQAAFFGTGAYAAAIVADARWAIDARHGHDRWPSALAILAPMLLGFGRRLALLLPRLDRRSTPRSSRWSCPIVVTQLVYSGGIFYRLEQWTRRLRYASARTRAGFFRLVAPRASSP